MAGANLDLEQGLILLEKEQAKSSSRPTFPTGIRSVDVATKKLLTSGKVIGIAKPSNRDAFDPLSHHIIATFLSSQHPTPPPDDSNRPPAVFIVTPPSSQTTLQIATLLNQRLQPTSTNERPDSTTLLSRIQLLQYLSLSGLTESIGDVSAALFDTPADSTASASASPPPAPTTILLIQGLSAILSETLRRNGATHAAAVAANVTRSLTHLSRSYADNLLVLVDLDVEVQKRAAAADGGGGGGGGGGGSGILSSAFSSPRGDVMALVPAETAVSAVLDAGMDVVIAVHDGFGKTGEHDRKEAKKGGPDRGRTSVVEVVKDRVGGSFGEWCLWVQSS